MTLHLHSQGRLNNHAICNLDRVMVTESSVMGEKMGIIVPRVGIEPTTFAFRASVLTIRPRRSPDVITLSTPTYLCGSVPKRSVQIWHSSLVLDVPL